MSMTYVPQGYRLLVTVLKTPCSRQTAKATAKELLVLTYWYEPLIY